MPLNDPRISKHTCAHYRFFSCLSGLFLRFHFFLSVSTTLQPSHAIRLFFSFSTSCGTTPSCRLLPLPGFPTIKQKCPNENIGEYFSWDNFRSYFCCLLFLFSYESSFYLHHARNLQQHIQGGQGLCLAKVIKLGENPRGGFVQFVHSGALRTVMLWSFHNKKL